MYYTALEVSESSRDHKPPLGWARPDLGRGYPSKELQKTQNGRGIFLKVVVEDITAKNCTNSTSVDKRQFYGIDDELLVRGETGQRSLSVLA